MRPWQGRLAWGLCGLTVCLGALLTWMFFAYPQYRAIGWPILTLGTVLWAATGALIVSRHPGHPVGWLFISAGLVIAINDPLIMYTNIVLDGGGLGPFLAGQVAAWFVQIFDLPLPLLLISMLFLLFPDGRLPSPRWRVVGWLALGSFVLFIVIAVVAVDPRDFTASDGNLNLGPTAQVALAVDQISFLLVFGASAVSVVVRMRRARGDQRQQLRWLATAGAAAAIAIVFPVMGDDVGLSERVPHWLLLLPLHLAFGAIAVAAGFAILRYRLYDIDLIINRAIVLAVLTAFVAAGYAAVVVVIGTAVGARATTAFWPSLLAIALVAVAFQPVRTTVQRLADRLVYGDRAAPYEALAEFSARLGESPSAAELLPRLAEATTRSVGARSSRVELDVPGGTSLAATWPIEADGDAIHELPVADRGENLGRINVSMPPGRSLRKTERRLLADFADQLGLAFRNARLEAELRSRVEQVARHNEELAVSRRRLVAVRDDECRQLAAAIDSEVLAHLRPLVDDLPHVAFGTDGDRARAETLLDAQLAAANAALHALRELSRGPVPTGLRRRGLEAALIATGLGERMRLAPSARRRFAPQLEAAAYLCAKTALRGASERTTLGLEADHRTLRMTISGVDPAAVARPDWAGVLDRVEVLGGEVVVVVSAGSATITVVMPLEADGDQGLAAAHTSTRESGPNPDLGR